MCEKETDLLSFLKQSTGLTVQTHNFLTVYGFDTNDTLMAMDIHKDLPQLTSICIGQRALLRQLIREFKTTNSLNSESDEDIGCNENCCQRITNFKTTIDKIKEALKLNGNEKVNQLKESLKRNKRSLTQTSHENIKLKTENMAKDIELKKLTSEVFRLKNRNNDKSCETVTKKFENVLKEKDVNIKKLEEQVSELKRENSAISDQFSDYHKNLLNDLQKMKTCLINESLVIHRAEQNEDSIEAIDQTTQIQDIIDENVVPNQSNSEPKDRQVGVRPQKLTPDMIEEVRKELLDEEVTKTCDNNYISLEVSINKSQDKRDPISHTSQVVCVSKQMTFEYLNPIETNENNELDLNFNDHNYSEVSLPKTPFKSELKRFYKKKRSSSFSEIRSRDVNKRVAQQTETTNLIKKLKTNEDTEDLSGGNKYTNLVFLSTEEFGESEEEEESQRSRLDSVTISSITGSKLSSGSKLISIDISGESECEGNLTEPSLTLKQNIISGSNVSQIATTNGYFSDSNEENRCSVVNAVAPIPLSLMRTRRSSVDSAVPFEKTGFRCTLPECDFVTLFKTKFDDHINNHVTYHFGQEIPDFWRPYFEEFKNNLPNTKIN